MQAATLLRDIFGFDSFRPGQEDIVDAVLAGRNTLAIMPPAAGNPCVSSCLPCAVTVLPWSFPR